MSACTEFHAFVLVPKLYVPLAFGIISLAISALKSILSVSASPNIILPSALIFPVACKFPVTFVFASNSILPVPFVAISTFAFESVVLIVLSFISKLSTISLFWYTT